MKKLLLLLIICVSFFLQSPAQGLWVPKANYTGIYPPGTFSPNSLPSFSVLDKGYYVPDAYVNDPGAKMYEYNSTLDTWTLRTHVPAGNAPQPAGGPWDRIYAGTFSIGNKGYVACGRDGNFAKTKDVWEYDPATNTWLRRSDFATVRTHPIGGGGLSSVGYLGLGDANEIDWRQFNPATNTWTAKANFPGNIPNGSVQEAWAYNNDIYVNFNNGSGQNYLWKYATATNTWSSIILLPASSNYSFTIGTKSFFDDQGGGFSSYDHSTGLISGNYGQAPISTFGLAHVSFCINGRGFLLAPNTNNNEFYEFLNYDIIPGALPGSTFCGGSTFNLSYTINGNFTAGNVFTAELSDAFGSFAAPVNIGSVSSVSAGSIPVTIPIATPSGTEYRIRISSSTPVMNGFDNGTDLSINIAPLTPNICMVTVDFPSQYNMIYWDKTPYNNVDSFIIHREVSTNTYVPVGAVAYADSSFFIDTARSIGPANGDPNITTYRYKLQIKDTCGNVSGLSPYHTTVYFNNLMNGTFTWNTYMIEGQSSTPITFLELMRDDNSTGVYNLIGAAAGTANTLNDPNYSTFQSTASWRVYMNGITCTPTMKQSADNNTMGAINTSRSNIKSMSFTGINPIAKNTEVKVYPNPSNNEFIVELTNNCSNCKLEIVTLLGASIRTISINSSQNKISTADMENGIYFLKIMSANKPVSLQKLVVQH